MTPYENFKYRVQSSVERLHYSHEVLAKLLKPDAVQTKNITLTRDSGEQEVFTAFRVQYNNARGPYKGGIRFHQQADLDEVSALAGMMAIKTSLLDIPLGGAKGGVTCNPKDFSLKELQQLSRAWIREMHPFLGVDRDIPAPDINTDSQVMSWMLDEYETLTKKSEPGFITGKPLELGGSYGRNEATAQGGVFLIQEWVREEERDPQSIRVAIEGFGNAGATAARLLADLGFRIVGVSDSQGAIYSEKGLDIDLVQKIKNEEGSVAVYQAEGVGHLSIESLRECACDVFIPAALDGAFTEKNAMNVQASLILELANGPTTHEADLIFNERNIIVIPDVLANAGGVTVSYFEWVQNREQFYWTEAEVLDRLRVRMLRAYGAVIDRSSQKNMNYRDSAYEIAVERIVRAMHLRGRFLRSLQQD